MVDAAQAVSSCAIDVQYIDCDFLAFSGHKVFGPFGIGVLYGKSKWLNQMPPFKGGGSMIGEVTTVGSTYLDAPTDLRPALHILLVFLVWLARYNMFKMLDLMKSEHMNEIY